MSRKPSARSLFVLLLLGIFASTTNAQPIDLNPDQPNRNHAVENANAIAAIPTSFKFVEDGVFTVAVSPIVPPIATYATDAHTLVGNDVDIAYLIAESLGRDLKLIPVAWADWPLGLQSGKYDAVISNVTVTEERKEKFDFSTYRKAVGGFYVPAASNIQSINNIKDIAGLRIITESGTNQEKIILEWNRINLENNLRPVELQYYDDPSASSLALLSGRADVEFANNATLAYRASNGQTRLVGTVSGGWPLNAEVGVATRKDSGLASAITFAINGLIDEGIYSRVLSQWGISAESVEKSTTNPPGLPKT